MDDFKPTKSSTACKSFVSESELEERRKKRQEEWEKTRRDDQPLECPEEEYDPRSLYERLQDQKRKRDEEFEESKKLKHLIRGIDDDEFSFLELVDKSKMEEELQRMKEERDAINELKSSVVTSAESPEKVVKGVFKSTKSQESLAQPKRSQAQLLAKIVKTKSSEKANEAEKPSKAATESKSEPPKSQTIKCIGILPGLVPYGSDVSSSDSENSSNDELTDFSIRPCIRISEKTAECAKKHTQ